MTTETSAGLGKIENQIEERYGVNRGLILAVGLGCVALGVVAVALPLQLFGGMIRLLGGLLLAAGGLKALQLLLGRRSESSLKRGWPAILGQVAIDLAMGGVLIVDWKGSTHVMVLALGVLFLVEGGILLFVGFRSPSWRSLVSLGICGAFTLAVGAVLLLGLVENPLRWAGVLVGIKLIAFGLTMMGISLTSSRQESSLVYGTDPIEPEAGNLYAVYFGTAFHLGVYLGGDRVVHYLNDNHVYKVTWKEFLAGRYPLLWTYPDIPPEPLEVIEATALAEVGKTYPYNLLTFNCENFAIFCRSGGKTKTSIYAQTTGGVTTVELHPLVGAVAELNLRAAEWLAFQFGVTWGKRMSLTVRRLGASVTT